MSTSPEVTYTEFTCKLITIRTQKSFEDVTGALEELFATIDIKKLTDMTAAGDQAGIRKYVEEISGDHKFSIFYQLDQGPSQRLAGYPVNCRIYLIGNPVIVNGLFEYGAMAGLGAPVRVCISQTDGEDVRIDVDEPTSFFSQFPELKESKIPASSTRTSSIISWPSRPEILALVCDREAVRVGAPGQCHRQTTHETYPRTEHSVHE